MTWDQQIEVALEAGDVDAVAYIPDSVLDPLVRRVEANGSFEAVRVAREEQAVALLSGAWLGGMRGALVCQTSGLANTFNALGSLSKPWGLPFVGIVSRRGNLDEFNLAQVPAGYGMPRLLDTIGVRNRLLEPDDEVETVVRMAVKTAFATEEPYVLLTEPTLTGGKP